MGITICLLGRSIGYTGGGTKVTNLIVARFFGSGKVEGFGGILVDKGTRGSPSGNAEDPLDFFTASRGARGGSSRTACQQITFSGTGDGNVGSRASMFGSQLPAVGESAVALGIPREPTLGNCVHVEAKDLRLDFFGIPGAQWMMADAGSKLQRGQLLATAAASKSRTMPNNVMVSSIKEAWMPQDRLPATRA